MVKLLFYKKNATVNQPRLNINQTHLEQNVNSGSFDNYPDANFKSSKTYPMPSIYP